MAFKNFQSAILFSVAVFCFYGDVAAAVEYAPRATVFLPQNPEADRGQIFFPDQEYLQTYTTVVPAATFVPSAPLAPLPDYAPRAVTFLPSSPMVFSAPSAPSAEIVSRAQTFIPQAPAAERAVVFMP